MRRTPAVRALGAPRAHVLHARAPSRRVALPPSPRPAPGPCSPAEPRPALAHSPDPSKSPLAPYIAAVRAFGGTPVSAASSCHGRRRPSHPRSPAAPVNSSSLSWSPSARARRRHVALRLQSDGRRRSYPRPPRDQPRTPKKGGPEPLRALRRPQASPLVLP